MEFRIYHGGFEELWVGKFIETEDFGIGVYVFLIAHCVSLFFVHHALFLKVSAEA